MRAMCGAGRGRRPADPPQGDPPGGDGGPGPGWLKLVGLGPGTEQHLTAAAKEALEASDTLVGYTGYIELIPRYASGREVIATGMGGEIRRCEEAIRRAAEGGKVVLVSSGDPGVYGLAGLVYELLEAQGLLDRVPVEVVPGITSALMAAARLGAPLNHDFAVVSLSDYLTPWEVIERRLRMAAQADFVIVLYNPRSRKRPEHLTRAQQVLLEYRDPLTPVGAVRHAGREEERIWLSTLEDLASLPIDMFTTVIVGNSHTWVRGNRMVTPRGYPIEPR